MCSNITAATIRQVATLARLGLSDADCAQYAAQCQKILAFVDQLANVDTAHIEPMAHPTAQPTAWRDDVVHSSGEADAILQNAPAQQARCFAVPQIIG